MKLQRINTPLIKTTLLLFYLKAVNFLISFVCNKVKFLDDRNNNLLGQENQNHPFDLKVP